MLRSLVSWSKRRDEGIALPAVIGLMAVGLILMSLILTSVISATGITTSTRANVQSQAAAEAGIAYVRGQLAAGTCTGAGAYASPAGTTPVFTATVSRPTGSGGWQNGCPVGLGTIVRIVATGYAAAPGTNGVSNGDVTHLEAILTAAASPTTIQATGPAIYAYNGGAFGNSGRLVSVDGSSPSVLIKTGNVTCTGAGQGAADFVVNGGTLLVDNSCVITGNAWSSGRMTFNGSGYVGGNATANGITMGGSARVMGKVWSTADLTLSGNPTVGGIAKAYSLVLDGGTLNSQAYVYGNTSVQNAGGSNLNNTVTTQTANPAPPSWWGGNSHIVKVNPITSPSFGSDLVLAPTVPDWVDFGSKPAEYTSEVWTGFAVYTMGANCGSTQVIAAVAAIGTQLGLIDGRNCVGALTINDNYNVEVQNDLAIMANTITMANSGRFTASSPHRLWLINPDAVANRALDCAGGISISGATIRFTNLTTMIYSPCRVNITSGVQITGQIFGGQVSVNNDVQLSYVPIGLPGVNLNDGSTAPTSPSSTTRDVQSLRNVQAAG